ncbi:MAG: indolepyruvate ferredoxin oxidoreductase subunit alpha [Christensenella sp.]|uniref:indolepyruvate ferredoxin oxidoreductase subunit alpha n=1 Tax=Christensenella sp. TaxID=1935934 RepID=UPI002B1F929A|nr:indolepyruvate ferredoxin oxidoreductase subunit alpha [Christensenella sp.]MEA5003720.1 indolepyruvate ferredoxin oxidoreductase subunit alpha [Christensenella sp.]
MKKIMLGNEAYAQGAYEGGVNVVSSYPGTPSTEVTENIVKYDEVYAEWAPNEKVALEVAAGACYGGARALCCMKHVGLNVAADPLFTASYTGVNGGLVILVADDPGMHSSQNEQDSRFYARSSHVPMLEPADSMEAKEFMKYAFSLSERFDTPVLLRSNTRISHSRGIVETGEREQAPLKDYQKDIKKYVMMPGMAKARHIVVEQRTKDLEAFAEECELNRAEYLGGEIGVITSGTCYNYVKEALPNASVLKLGMVYPLPKKMISEFASKVKTLYVIEELEPFFENQVRVMGIPVSGKELFTVQGEYSVNMIKEKICGETCTPVKTEALPMRPPVLCPGCPHRAVYYMFNKLKLTAMGDIGCYTLGAGAPLSAIDTTLCMGASIGMAHGMEKARGEDFARKLVSVIGDSTFMHSGITGLVNMLYNGATSTVMILDNSTTGMTGHQDHATTGKNAKGEPAPSVNIEKLVETIGVKHVRVLDPFDLPELEKALREETQREELSVIITRRPCVLIDRASIKEALCVSDECRNCGVCMKLGCPAIVKGENKVDIDASLCIGCGLCADVCPFHAIGGAAE